MFITTVMFLMFVKSFSEQMNELVINSITRGAGSDVVMF